MRGARGLLAMTSAVLIGARPVSDGELEVELHLAGEWKAEGATATSLLIGAWDDLAESTFGSLLGLNHPAVAPIVSVTPGDLRLKVVLRVKPLVRGLRDVVKSDVVEMLGLPPSR